MEVKFSVGEMAKLNGISKQTLIYYDNENIFKPKIIDKNNRYRYYTADQLEEMDSILMLREMGLSLHEIKDYMENRNYDKTIKMLNKQKEIICENIKKYKLMEKRLDNKIKNLNTIKEKNLETFIFCDEKILAIKKLKEPKGLLQVDICLKELLNEASKNNYPHFYQIGDMVSEENLKNENFLNFDYAFLPLEDNELNINTHIKPKGVYARAFHKGSYKNTGETYKKLINEINKNNYKITGYSYEFCVLDSLTSKKDIEYITEIQIKVEK